MRIGIVLTMLVLLFGYAAAHDLVVTRNSNLRTEPNSSSQIRTLLTPGDELQLLEIQPTNGYYRILDEVGVGWVWSRNVEIFVEYDRDDYRYWIDADGDCQHTREEVLVAESMVPVTFLDRRECKVRTGKWFDPYTGKTFTDPSKLDIDHVVPLKNAHRSGAWQWSKQKKQAYANDLENEEHLIAVSIVAIRAKGARGPESWRPSNTEYLCQYAKAWERIKNRWGLSMTEAEAAACSGNEEHLF